MTENRAVHPWPAAVVGAVSAVLAAWAMVPFRDQLGVANAALVLAAIVVLAAEFGGPYASIAVGVVAALAFNVLHTRPYLRVVIEHPSDVIAFVLIAAFGLLLAWWRRP